MKLHANSNTRSLLHNLIINYIIDFYSFCEKFTIKVQGNRDILLLYQNSL